MAKDLESSGAVLEADGVGEGLSDCANPGLGILPLLQFLLDVFYGSSNMNGTAAIPVNIPMGPNF